MDTSFQTKRTLSKSYPMDKVYNVILYTYDLILIKRIAKHYPDKFTFFGHAVEFETPDTIYYKITDIYFPKIKAKYPYLNNIALINELKQNNISAPNVIGEVNFYDEAKPELPSMFNNKFILRVLYDYLGNALRFFIYRGHKELPVYVESCMPMCENGHTRQPIEEIISNLKSMRYGTYQR